MNTSTIIGLVNNAALLLALGVLYETLGSRPRGEKPTIQQALTGVILGAIGIAVMLNPWEFTPGVVFDTRSVLLSVSGLFFGTAPTLVAVLMTGIFRLYNGGAGAWTGVAVIVTSGGIGIAWRHLRRRELEDMSVGELYIMGLVVHVAMLLWMFSLPWSLARGVLSAISLPVMAIHPVGTALLGWLMANRGARKRAEGRIEHLNLVLQAIRNVNQLITRERDRDRLLQGACDNLIETRGYYSAWVALLDESGGLVTSAEAGLGEDFLPLVEQLRRGEAPACGRMALAQAEAVVIEDRAATCAGCPLSKNHGDMAAMAVRLEHGGKVYGLLTIRTPTDFVADEEERALFQEVAADIAFALHGIELEEERKRAEERYRELFENTVNGVALHDIVTNENGEPVDYVFLETNSAFEELTGLKDVIGKRVTEVLPGIEETPFIEVYGKVALTGEPVSFEQYAPQIDRHYNIKAFSPRRGQFAAVFSDITERERAEEALRKSESRLVEAQRIAGMGDFTWEIETGKATWSEGMHELLGYDKSEKIDYARVNAEIHHPDDLERTTNWLNECLESGKSHHPPNEYRLIRKDGKVLYVQTNVSVRHEDGKPLEMIGTCIDITERKRAEEALQEERDRAQRYLDVASIMFVVIDADQNVSLINQRGCEILGREEEEIVGKNWFDTCIPERLTDKVKAVFNKLMDGEIELVEYYENPVVTKGGEERIIAWHNTLLTDDIGNTIGALSSGEDITERVRAEDRIKESQLRYQELFTEALSPIFLIDPEAKVIEEVNPAGLELTGYKREELRGAHFAKIMPEDRPVIRAMLEEVEEEEEGLRLASKTILTKQGEKRVVNAAFSYYVYAAKPLIQVIAADITERVRAEAELRKHHEHLEKLVEERTKELRDAHEKLVRKEKLAVLGQLAGGVGHELRNPLGVISNAVYYLKMVLPDADEDSKEYLEMISEEVRNSTKIISDLLDFSRTKMPDREEAAVSELAAVVLKKRPPPENVAATTQIAPDLPPVFVDPQQMGQVLGNLVANAYQAMKEGGKLTISAQAEEGQVSISVGDTGCGIPPENLAKIFEPLFTTKARGIGLGLATSRILVEANGGSMEVESEEGKGSTFTLRLPNVSRGS